MRTNLREKNYTWRLYFVSSLLLLALAGLVWRIVDLGIVKRDFLLRESTRRSIRNIETPAIRGNILDRNGELLAKSAPIDSAWINPKTFKKATAEQWQTLSKIFNLPISKLKKKISVSDKREFIYLKRHISAEVADKIKNLKIPGVLLQQEYQRYYPDAEVTSQIIGITNIDDKGQEGLELAYEHWLRGIPGKKKVLQDRLGNVITDIAIISQPQTGQNLVLSIDRKIQHLAYQALKNTVEKYQAESGSAVVTAAKTGEILAMVSMPTCNPNKRENITHACYKNKAVTDLFEPGSTIKAFTIASALESGKYTPTSTVDTNPGHFKVEKHIIYDNDHHNNGLLTVTGVLQKSSDIGVAKIALSLPPNNLLDMLKRINFGQTTQSAFPGEATGVLPDNLNGRPLMLATIAYGYGISTTALQLAHAYTVIANGGISRPVSFLKLDKDQIPEGKRVISQTVANQILTMLQSVLELGGTGTKAKIQGYSVAGKTGTSRIAKPRGYYTDRHGALFAGIAPASNPELVVIVVIKNPRGLYHGGSVAAPAFADIMHGALRILNIPPDAQ